LHHVTLSSYIALYALDQVHAEPESKVQAEQAQAEVLTNLALDQGKVWCISPTFLGFFFLITIFMYA
jgi:hypothetical protein